VTAASALTASLSRTTATSSSICGVAACSKFKLDGFRSCDAGPNHVVFSSDLYDIPKNTCFLLNRASASVFHSSSPAASSYDMCC
jgi:hypothetical protein